MGYLWQIHWNCVIYNGFGANRRLHLWIPGGGCLDICILLLIKRLCSVGELRKWECTEFWVSLFAYNSTDNFLSPIPVSDWLISSYGNAIFHQKKEMKMTKTEVLWWTKNNKQNAK